MAQDTPQTPQITLTVKDKPLGDILEIISQDTGYRFNLNNEWKDYPVSSSIEKLPLERGLKRLLRSLNHTIIWESDRVVTIKIIGTVAPKTTSPDTSPLLSSPTSVMETEPVVEPESIPEDQSESADVSLEETHPDGEEEDVDNFEPGNIESTPQAGNQDESAEQDLIETDALPDDTTSGSS